MLTMETRRNLRRPKLVGSALHARYCVSKIATDDTVFQYHDAYLIPLNEHQAYIINREAGEFMSPWTQRRSLRTTYAREIWYSIILPCDDTAMVGQFHHKWQVFQSRLSAREVGDRSAYFDGHILQRGPDDRLFGEYPVHVVFPKFHCPATLTVLQFED